MDEGVLKGKFLGALVGTAVGDAVGSGFEWQRAAELQAIEWAADRRELLAYTDDTHMMIGTAESLVQKEGFDGEHMRTFSFGTMKWNHGAAMGLVRRMYSA